MIWQGSTSVGENTLFPYFVHDFCMLQKMLLFFMFPSHFRGSFFKNALFSISTDELFIFSLFIHDLYFYIVFVYMFVFRKRVRQ
jgi:hypothetical protein